MKLLPVALDVENRAVLIVGGGAVAARKASAFLECGARVTVVAPQLGEGFPPVHHRAKGYERADLEGFALVLACTNAREINAQIADDARALNLWCNIADDPHRSDFHTAAVVRRGDVSVGITTGGHSPVLAAHLKGEIEATLGQEYAQLIEIAGSYAIGKALRGAFWRRMLQSDALSLLRAGKRDEARALIQTLLP